MPELNDVLLELRDLGIGRLPEVGDPGDRRMRQALAAEMAAPRARALLAWARRRVRVGRFAVPTVAVLAVAATATAAAAISLSASSLFQADPQGLNFNGDIETVLPSTVHQVGAVTIPDYGTVTVWGARTKPGGFCFAMKLPDGSWGGFPNPLKSMEDRSGWAGGSVPGCFQTQQQQILKEAPLTPGQQPSAATGQAGGYPSPLESWENEVNTSDGANYTIYVGYVETQGTAATVRDADSGASTHVLTGGYFVLAEPTLRCAQVRSMAKLVGTGRITDRTLCPGDTLRVLDANQRPLKPDYTYGQMLPGYRPGPSQN